MTEKQLILQAFFVASKGDVKAFLENEPSVTISVFTMEAIEELGYTLHPRLSGALLSYNLHGSTSDTVPLNAFRSALTVGAWLGGYDVLAASIGEEAHPEYVMLAKAADHEVADLLVAALDALGFDFVPVEAGYPALAPILFDKDFQKHLVKKEEERKLPIVQALAFAFFVFIANLITFIWMSGA